MVKTYSFEISRKEAEEIEQIAPDLILLCGGTDGGNRETVINNARTLSKVKGNFTIVMAGNKNAADEVARY